MLFRPIEVIWNQYQKGFSLFSFGFPDDSYYSLFALIKMHEWDGWWFSLFFNSWSIYNEEVIEFDDDED
jgi:hypothetical protein